jgi:hypothetical protein
VRRAGRGGCSSRLAGIGYGIDGHELAPGASAEALLQVAEAGNFAPCTTTSVRGLRVYPPNQRDAVFVPMPTKACAQTSAQQLTVRPVVLRG